MSRALGPARVYNILFYPKGNISYVELCRTCSENARMTPFPHTLATVLGFTVVNVDFCVSLQYILGLGFDQYYYIKQY